MASCAYCHATIILGGKRSGDLKFCNDQCLAAGEVLRSAGNIPAEAVEAHARKLLQGLCPQCQGAGPVEVFTAYRIWSALLMTSWRNEPHVCCRSCGTRHQLRSLLISVFLGWWGIPWGVILTPVQIVRNILGLLQRPDMNQPSRALESCARIELGAVEAIVRTQGRPPAATHGQELVTMGSDKYR